jgi:hypothetical protein
MVVRPSTTQCAPMVVPAPIRTDAPMTAYGPTDDRCVEFGLRIDDRRR